MGCYKEAIPIFSLKLYLFICLLCVCMCALGCVRKGAVCHGASVGVGGLRGEVSSLPIPSGSWDRAQVGRLGNKGSKITVSHCCPQVLPLSGSLVSCLVNWSVMWPFYESSIVMWCRPEGLSQRLHHPAWSFSFQGHKLNKSLLLVSYSASDMLL